MNRISPSLLALGIFPLSCAAVQLPSVFSDGMVLQRDREVTVWGWADPGAEVTVAFGGQNVSAECGSDGRWEARLDALTASAEPRSMSVSSPGGETRTISDILVGDVWILAGQSNMAWPLRDCDDGTQAAAGADYPWLRVFQQAPHAGAADEPARDVRDGKWSTCRPQNAGEISGMGFFFARALHKAVDVPVGLVNTAMGGTAIQCWIDAATLRSLPEAARYLEWEKGLRRTHDEDSKEWTRIETRQHEESPSPDGARRPANGPPLGENMFRRHSALFNGKVAPLQPFAARGIIWYQGEGNAMEADAYAPMLSALIDRWREGWRDPDLPFLVVQLPRFRTENNWAGLRAAQERVAQQKSGVHLAVTIDTGAENNMHPGDKLPVGERLARLARREIFGEAKLAARAPRAISAQRQGGFVEVHYELDGTALRQEPRQLAGFTWIGAGEKSHAATAQIAGPDRVRIDAPAEAAFIAYAFDAWPEVSLFDNAGLPAAPFRLPIEPS